MLSVELPHGLNGTSKKSTFNIQQSTLNLTSVEHRSKRPFAIEELLGFIFDTQLSDHLEIIIAALHAEPSVLHTDKGNAGNQ